MTLADLDPVTAHRLADLVLIGHVAFVAFVVCGLLIVWLGHGPFAWGWVDAWVFRLLHAAAIAFVVAESWLGIACPLTLLERALRMRSGGAALGADERWIEHGLSRLLFYDAPSWIFTLTYTLFGCAVLATWLRFPPRRRAAHPRG